MDQNPYQAPEHYVERLKPVLVLRSKKLVVAAMLAIGSFYLICLYFDWNSIADVIGDAIFASVFFAVAALIISGRWPRQPSSV